MMADRPHLAGEEEDQGEALRSELRALKREIRAVRVAIEAIDEGAQKERQEKASQATTSGIQQPGSVVADGEEERQATQGSGNDKGLQRAGLAQRLSDLVSQKQELKVTGLLCTILRKRGPDAATSINFLHAYIQFSPCLFYACLQKQLHKQH